MIKKQQKWIALLVTLTFVWLLQVSVTPLGAAAVEQGPGYVESVGHQAAPAQKKGILPYVLIGVGVVAVAAVLFLVVLKTSYDITGEWTIAYYGPGLTTSPITFTGNKETGTAAMNYLSGTYTVDGKKVAISMTQGISKWEYIGEFTTKDHIEGDFKYYDNNVLLSQYNGTFYMDRTL